MTKFTRDSAVGILKALNEITDTKYSKFLLFAISKNKEKLVEIAKDIEDREKGLYTDDYKAFEAARVNLIKKFAVLDEDGEVALDDKGNATIPSEKTAAADEEFSELLAGYKDTLDSFKVRTDEFKSHLLEEIDLDFVKTDFKHLPETLDQRTYLLLNLFIKEDTVEA